MAESRSANNSDTVAVTGADGFLGGHVCRALLRRGYAVRAVIYRCSDRQLPEDVRTRVESRTADVRDLGSLHAALRGSESVVHCAAAVTIDDDPGGLAAAVNVTGTRNVVAACTAVGARRLVHVSSIHAFGPLRGSMLDGASALNLRSKIPYVATKAEAHLIVLDAVREGRIDASLICPSGLIGPGDSEPSFVGSMLLAIAHREIPRLLDLGLWWSDVRDVAAAIAAAVGASAGGGHVHLAAGTYAQTTELARLCSRVLGRDLTRRKVPLALAVAGLPFIGLYAAIRRRPPLYTRNSLLLLQDCPISVDESSAKRELGYESRPLDDSVRDALAWFQERGML